MPNPDALADRVRRLALIGSHGALNRTDQMRLAADALTLLARVSHEETTAHPPMLICGTCGKVGGDHHTYCDQLGAAIDASL